MKTYTMAKKEQFKTRVLECLTDEETKHEDIECGTQSRVA